MWVKLVRVYGGCLGAKGRRRARQDCEKPRCAVWQALTGGTRMGKPSLHKQVIRFGEKVSGRTETSKYPEEKKSTEIPLVVANERGRAQTIRA